MICGSCRERRHETCRGGSWCDCQHQGFAGPEDAGALNPGTLDADALEGGPAVDAGAATAVERRPDPASGESAMNWKRQG